MGILLCRPKKKIDECDVSYLIRLAESNCVKNIGNLLKLGGLGWKNNRVPVTSILNGKFDLTPYLRALGVTPAASSASGVCGHFQCGVDTPYIFARYPKVCHRCIEEMGYCKAVWAFLPVVYCSTHNVLLTDIDSDSGKPISWYRNAVRIGPSPPC